MSINRKVSAIGELENKLEKLESLKLELENSATSPVNDMF